MEAGLRTSMKKAVQEARQAAEELRAKAERDLEETRQASAGGTRELTERAKRREEVRLFLSGHGVKLAGLSSFQHGSVRRRIRSYSLGGLPPETRDGEGSARSNLPPWPVSGLLSQTTTTTTTTTAPTNDDPRLLPRQELMRQLADETRRFEAALESERAARADEVRMVQRKKARLHDEN